MVMGSVRRRAAYLPLLLGTVVALTVAGPGSAARAVVASQGAGGSGQAAPSAVPAAMTPIHDIQGASHRSPRTGQDVTGVTGVVTAVAGNGFYLQDQNADADPATSEALFEFTSARPAVSVGDGVEVAGRVAEFRPGGAASANLTTELTGPSVVVHSSGNPLPAPTVVGIRGRVPPRIVIDDDAIGDVETSGTFDATSDGIDFYESMEAMRVQLNDAVAVGPSSAFGEIPVVGDGGERASVRTARGGVVVRPDDFNPERIHLDDVLAPTPVVNVADRFPGAVVGVLDYSFGNFKFLVTATPPPPPAGSRAR
jgi:uncharacterized protein